MLCSTGRKKNAERAEARVVLELDRVVSCRSREQWWRTKLDFGSGEPLDDFHRTATLGTTIKFARVFGEGGVLLGW